MKSTANWFEWLTREVVVVESESSKVDQGTQFRWESALEGVMVKFELL